jgi:hypothetical protein
MARVYYELTMAYDGAGPEKAPSESQVVGWIMAGVKSAQHPPSWVSVVKDSFVGQDDAGDSTWAPGA